MLSSACGGDDDGRIFLRHRELCHGSDGYAVDGDGCQYVFVNVSKYDVLEFGGSVSFTIPEGFLKNSNGTKYNYATDVSM